MRGDERGGGGRGCVRGGVGVGGGVEVRGWGRRGCQSPNIDSRLAPTCSTARYSAVQRSQCIPTHQKVMQRQLHPSPHSGSMRSVPSAAPLHLEGREEELAGRELEEAHALLSHRRLQKHNQLLAHTETHQHLYTCLWGGAGDGDGAGGCNMCVFVLPSQQMCACFMLSPTVALTATPAASAPTNTRSLSSSRWSQIGISKSWGSSSGSGFIQAATAARASSLSLGRARPSCWRGPASDVEVGGAGEAKASSPKLLLLPPAAGSEAASSPPVAAAGWKGPRAAVGPRRCSWGKCGESLLLLLLLQRQEQLAVCAM